MSQDGSVKDKKQSRLPFKVLDVKKAILNSSHLKKRKLSDNETITVANKLSKKEDNVDIAIISVSANAENVPSVDLVAKNGDSNKLENGFQNKNSTLISIDDKSLNQKSNSKHNADKQINVDNVPANLSSSDYALLSSVTTRPNSKGDSVEYISNNESEIEFSRTETSELDASLIFNQGSQLGDSAGENLSSSKKKRQSPMNPKKIEEKEKRKQEKLRLRAEREKQLQHAREEKKKQKEEEKQQRDQNKLKEKQRKQRELEEKKLKEQKEREERKEKMELDRLEKLKAKEEEKLKKLKMLNEKQDEKKKKEEDRLKKLEEKRKSEEEEEKKKLKEKASFAKFFIKNETSPLTPPEDKNGIFKPFEVKKDMTVASVVPAIASSLFKKDDFETSFEEQESSELYLNDLRLGKHIPLFKKKADVRKEVQTKCDDDEDEVVIVDDSLKKTKHKAKLLQFHENVRPPYYGTWMKQSTTITSRKPFAEDTAFFDYEVDSDEDWEEGGPGESLSGTDDEKESEDDYEVDNEFFVPHGYLSADEEKDDERGENPENLQKRLKMRQLEFQEQLKKKCLEMKPRITGCLWLSESSTNEDGLKQKLSLYAAVTLIPIPIITSQIISNTAETEATDPTITKSVKPKTRKKVPDEALPYYIQLLHANTNNRNIIVKEFQQFWLKKSWKLDGNPDVEEQPKVELSKPNISKRQLDITMQKIASWMRCPDPAMNRLCWWVCHEVREKYNCKDLPIPNQWNYITRKERQPSPNKVKSSNVESGIEKPTPIEPLTPNILKFAKVIVTKPSNSGMSEKVNDEKEKTPTSVETKNIPDMSKKVRRIVPTTIVGKNKGKAPVSLEKMCSKELDKKGLEDNIKVIPLNTLCKSGCSDVSSNNMDTSQAKVSESIKHEEQIKVNKTAADGTPSILKFVKRIAPVKVEVSFKKPKLIENNDLNESCIVLD